MRQKSLDNAYMRFKYLKTMLEHPEKTTASVRNALAGQRLFSQLAIDGEFEPIALNSLKAAANNVLINESESSDGWTLMNDMRAALYERVKNLNTSRKQSDKVKSDTNEKNRAKDIARNAELMANQCSIAYLDLFSKVVNIISSEQGLDHRTRLKLHNVLSEHKQMYGDLFSPNTEKSQELKLIHGGLED